MKKINWLLIALLALAVGLNGCMQTNAPKEPAKAPEISEKLTLNEEGIPVITVYNLREEAAMRMDVESYVEGVLAGEMKNDWPEEALKAQAILARTYVMRFLETRTSQYEGADISTDINEAQAYAETLVNDRIKKAVADTRGMVVSYEGELANTWFHAHSGGVTELPVAGLEYKENPPYTHSVKSSDAESAPENVKNWKVSFTNEEMKNALKKTGVSIEKVESISIGEKSESGRAVKLVINGKNVSAPTLRISLGSDKLRSTLITNVQKTADGVTFEGRGYGHGVGMSQWGAYAMAENGKTYEDMINHYFKNVDIVKMWD